MEEKYVDEKLVNHPNHYNKEGRKECWDEMEELFGPRDTIVFCILNAYKYMYRAGTKGGNSELQDDAKAKVYLKKAIEIADRTRHTDTIAAIRKMQILADIMFKGWMNSDE